MFLKHRMFSIILSLVLLVSISSDLNAISRRVLLHEKVEKCDLIIIGNVIDMQILYSNNSGEILSSPAEIIYEIEVNKVLFGEEKNKKILIFEMASNVFSDNGPSYMLNTKNLFFLKKTNLKPEFQVEIKRIKEKNKKILDSQVYYENIFGDEGVLYLGVDEDLLENFKSLKEFKSNNTVLENKNLNYLKSLEKFLYILNIKDKSERKKALENTLLINDEVLKENASFELNEMNIKE